MRTSHKRARVRLEADAPASSGAWIVAALLFTGSGSLVGAGVASLVWWLT